MFALAIVVALATMAPVSALPVSTSLLATPKGGPDHLDVVPTPTAITHSVTATPALVTPTASATATDEDTCWRHWPHGCKKTEVAAIAMLIACAVVAVIRLGLWIRSATKAWKAKRMVAPAAAPPAAPDATAQPKTSTSSDESLPTYSEATLTPATYTEATVTPATYASTINANGPLPDHSCIHGDLGVVRCACAQ